MTNSLAHLLPSTQSLTIPPGCSPQLWWDFIGSTSPLPASYLPTPTPRKDSPSDARPCTPQPAPPTPRARRWGQQRPIICRQRLLNRVGCWLKNSQTVKSGQGGFVVPKVIIPGGPYPCSGKHLANSIAVQVRKQLISDSAPSPLTTSDSFRFWSHPERAVDQSPTPVSMHPAPGGQILIRQQSSVSYSQES